MKLYKEILIEAAEQAEQLPTGTVVLRDETAPWLKQNGPWQKRADGSFVGDRLATIGATGVIGGTALVPTEAEEVRVIEHGRLERDMCGCTVLETSFEPGARDYRRTEYRTPWEETP